MKRRAGALLMALALVMTSITPYAEEMTVETYSEESTEVSTETVVETLPEEESQAEEIPVPEVEVGTGETLEEGSSEEESSPEETPAEEISEEDLVTYSEEPVTEESEEETETETETESEEESDPNADVETAADWEATLPSLTGVWGDDIVRVAQSQLGYTESTRNFEKVENAAAEPGSESASNKKGYTRYGAWYGSPYEDWCAMFASFCLYYAGVPTSVMPEDSGVVSWIQTLQYDGIYAEKSTAYQPVSGDLIFFAMGSQGADHVGIIESTVTAIDENGKSYVAGIYTIEGNCGNAVRENYYDVSDSRILGYGVLSGQPGIDEETADEWEATLPALTGDLANDVTLVAESQLGYTESSRNFTLSSDWSKNGYTRYGAWYGEPYADWSTMFVSFCLTYANSGLTPAGSAAGLIDVMKAADLYEDADYVPSAGDIVFLSKEGDGADASAVIERVDTAFNENGSETVVSLSVIEGDGNDAVREASYSSEYIIGYAKIAGEKWDGFFDAEQPELGGIIVAQIAGDLGGTVTAEIPAGAFDEMVTLTAEAAVYAPEDADPDLLDAVLAAAGKTEEDPVYDLYVIDIAFINGDGEEVEPAAAVSIAVDTSKAPVDINAGEADAEKLDKGIYHINNESGAADALGSVVLLNEDNDLTGLAFASDTFSPFAVLVADGEAEKIYTAEDGGVLVTVTAPAGALPADAELQVILYGEDTAEYEEAAEIIGADVEVVSDEETEESGVATLAGYGAAEETESESKNLAVMDIKFVSDGEEVEPAEVVNVVIDASALMPEDVDESTIEVQHLVENADGEVTPVVVASETAVAEFEVESFSTFTIEWNDGTDATITVHVYNINGTSIDEELDEFGYSGTGGVISIDELVSHLEQNASYTSIYTFAYATIYYENTNNQGGFDPYTIGDEDNSVTQISKSGANYTVTYGGSSTTVSDPYVVTIHLYYSLPTVTLTATENTDGTVGFTTESDYFTGDTSGAGYRWALNDDSFGSITPGEDGTATFTWSEDAKAGDQVSVTVTMTVGNQTASDTYTLTYGTESTTITVTLNGTAQANANVALVDEDGNTVATGKTGEDGTVTLDVVPGTYTVGVTYVTYNSAGGGSTTRYTNSGTVTVAEDGTITGDTTVNLTTSVSSGPGGNTNGSGSTGWSEDGEYYYEHIDVKVAVAEGADADAVFSDLDRIYVYDEYGNLLYYSLDLVENDDTTDYNCLFDVNGTEGHSLVISSSDTIILVFEVYEDGQYKTYTETITPSTTYPEGEYYSYSDVNAYQLYNSIYATNISADDWATALNNGTLQTLLGSNYNENGIAIGGLSFIQVADYLCDTRGTEGQAGLDFVIDVGVISVLYEAYNLQIAKSLEGVPDTVTSVETFEFTLQELTTVSDSTGYTEAIWDTVNNALGEAASASTGDSTKESDGTWSAIADFEDFLEYEAEEGTIFFYYVLSEKDATTATAEVQYYGIKVSVEYSSLTGIATVTASYCELVETDEKGVYNRNSGWTGLMAYTGEDENGEYTYFSIPFINIYSTTGFELAKVDVSGTALDGAVFTMTTSDGETTLYFTSVTDEDGNVVYTLATSETGSDKIAVTGGGPVSIQGIAAGTYTLSETTTPEGYLAVEDFTVTIADDGTVTVEGTNVSVEEGSDTVTVTDLEAISISVTKTWVDNNNAYTTRPDSIEVTITGTDDSTYTLTLNDGNNWTATQDNLPRTDSEGTEITYTVTEKTVNGYTGTVEENEGDPYTYTITNTLETVDVEGSKTWVGDSESTRPESITVNLYADDAEDPIDTVTVTSDNDWAWSFTDLPKYQSDGTTEIEYTVQEEAISGGYIPTYEYDEDGNVTITNAIPELHKYVSDPSFGESTDDNLDEDEADNNDTLEYKLEADHIGGAHGLVLHDFLDDQLDLSTLKIQSVILYKDANDTGTILEEEVDYTLTTGNCTVEGCNLGGCSFEIHIEDKDVEDLSSDAYVVVIFDIKLVEGTENFDEETYIDEIDNDLSLSFTAFSVTAWAEPVEVETFSYGFDLYKYDSETVEPLADVEFILSKSGDDGTVYAQFEVTDNTYLLSEWVDSEDDATPIVTGSDGKAVVEGLHDGTFFIKETKALEGYEQKVGDITVTITVDPDDPFSPTITATNADVDGLEVQISNTPGSDDVIEIIGSKTWDDSNDADGIRPSSIVIHLLADGEEIDKVTVTADDNWAWSFKDMPKYQEDGTTEIVYTITEDAIESYESSVDGYNVTNTHTPETETESEETETPETEPETTPRDPVKSVDVGNGTTVEVGQELTYTVTYYNHNTEPVTVTIADRLDTGLEFVSASDGGVYDEYTRTINWTIADAAAVSEGSVTFKVKVTEDALTTGSVENVATVRIGNDDAVGTNLVSNPVVEEGAGGGDSVKTGDTTPLGPVAGIMAMALALLAGTVVYRRRRATR